MSKIYSGEGGHYTMNEPSGCTSCAHSLEEHEKIAFCTWKCKCGCVIK